MSSGNRAQPLSLGTSTQIGWYLKHWLCLLVIFFFLYLDFLRLRCHSNGWNTFFVEGLTSTTLQRITSIVSKGLLCFYEPIENHSMLVIDIWQTRRLNFYIKYSIFKHALNSCSQCINLICFISSSCDWSVIPKVKISFVIVISFYSHCSIFLFSVFETYFVSLNSGRTKFILVVGCECIVLLIENYVLYFKLVYTFQYSTT